MRNPEKPGGTCPDFTSELNVLMLWIMNEYEHLCKNKQISMLWQHSRRVMLVETGAAKPPSYYPTLTKA